ncbi:PLP-dependent cysteine synthase family protein [Halolamina salifodinae]|uniref:Cysteine synthase B n=1 Tax=Halolamina salifodinae TaxID=1202767 RepID=A0A8T4H0L7_9EURY|nr:pyridoxal-phosphate dependent enzyme [Halolamina salifodinae]MBP1987334.1 cysteine synthase B [Halolamina salifodinae]
MTASPPAVDETRIGRTPLLELALDVAPTVYAKAEWYNLPSLGYGGGSVKTRIAREMLDGAEERGDLDPGMRIVEPTSGNTGSEIARLGVARGYDVTIVMPDDAAAGKVGAVRDAGAEIEFVAAEAGYDACIERCDEIVADDSEGIYEPNQYENPDNPGAHERTTAAEIWEQTDGGLTHFVAGVGTGGTVTGAGRGLHDRGDVEVVGFEPVNPTHAIGGLKYLRSDSSIHPGTYDESVLDRKLYVETADADDDARDLRERYADRPVEVADLGQYDEATVRENLRVDDQFLVGPSSGAGVAAIRQLDAAGELDGDDVVVTMLPDRGDKYADGLWEGYVDSAD